MWQLFLKGSLQLRQSLPFATKGENAGNGPDLRLALKRQ
jgi:hypothetical protein